MNNFLKSDRNFGVLCIAYVVFLLIVPITFSPTSIKWLMSETGPIEILSIVAWLALAAQFALSSFRPSIKWPMALLFAGFGAREADLHKTLTTTGMLKLTYYTRSPAPLYEKIIAGTVALAFIGLLLYGAYHFLRFLLKDANWRSPAGYWLILAGFLFPLCKVFDRLPNVLLVEHGIALPPLLGAYCGTLEEGLELLVPVILMWIAYAKKRSFTAFNK
ncbi:MAG: hypothetical protein C4516_05365 [Oxalobacter sp.]|nr:MAG: hypothetical protein C4516_05365 [Oxalobacter sp.]